MNEALLKAPVGKSTLRFASCLGFCGGKIAKRLICSQTKISNHVSDSTKKAIDSLCSSVMMPLRMNSTNSSTSIDLSREEFIKINNWMIKNMPKRNQYLQNSRDFKRYVDSESCVYLSRVLISMFLRRLDLVPLARVSASMLNELSAPPNELVVCGRVRFSFERHSIDVFASPEMVSFKD